MYDYTSDLEARLVFIGTDEGGRAEPVRSGYRAPMFFDGEYFDANYEFIGTDLVEPGETVVADLRLLHPELVCDKLHPGKEFEVREGTRTIAMATTRRIIDLVTHAKSPR